MNHEMLERYIHQPLLLSEEGAQFLNLLPLAKINREHDDFIKAALLEQGVPEVFMLNFGADTGYKSYPVTEAGIAIITVAGSLEANSNYYGSYWTGYEAIESRFLQAMADDDVRGVALVINSNGGEAAGCFECGNMIADARGAKPIRALVKHRAYSAAYAVASGADMIVGTPSANVGSIGVILAHIDQSKMLDNIGVKVSLIHAGEQKADGNPYEALPDAVRGRLQGKVDALYSTFVETVAKNRSINADTVRGTEAGTFQMSEAIELGLADKEQTPAEFFAEFENDLNKPTLSRGLSAMAETQAEQPTAPTAAPVAVDTAKLKSDAQTSERTRIDSILSCEEATGRSALASHFALKTGMSVEDARAALAASPAEAPAAAQSNPLENAMQAEQDADLGTGSEGDGGEQLTAAQQLFSGFDKKRKQA